MFKMIGAAVAAIVLLGASSAQAAKIYTTVDFEQFGANPPAPPRSSATPAWPTAGRLPG